MASYQGLIPSRRHDCLSRSFKSAEKQSFLGRLLFQTHTDKPQRRGKTSHMDPNGAGSVQYDRWNDDNINMNVEGSQSTMTRLYNTVCVGSTGIAVKTTGALAALVSIYIIGYVTGYYIHRC